MKVIDLLNKIVNEEEMPKKIRVKNLIWAYEKGFKQYKNDNFQELVKFLLGYYKEDGFSFTLYGALNCEVELIEDEIDIDSIEELLKIEEYEVDKTDTVINRNKINELVQAVKQLNKEIKELKSKEYCQVCGVELTEKNKYMKGMCYDCKYGEE